jgi:hypothetical protein
MVKRKGAKSCSRLDFPSMWYLWRHDLSLTLQLQPPLVYGPVSCCESRYDRRVLCVALPSCILLSRIKKYGEISQTYGDLKKPDLKTSIADTADSAEFAGVMDDTFRDNAFLALDVKTARLRRICSREKKELASWSLGLAVSQHSRAVVAKVHEQSSIVVTVPEESKIYRIPFLGFRNRFGSPIVYAGGGSNPCRLSKRAVMNARDVSLECPSALAWHEEDQKLYFSDLGTHTVYEIDSDSRLRPIIGTGSQGGGQLKEHGMENSLSHPVDLAFLHVRETVEPLKELKLLLVADSKNERIIAVNPEGRKLETRLTVNTADVTATIAGVLGEPPEPIAYEPVSIATTLDGVVAIVCNPTAPELWLLIPEDLMTAGPKSQYSGEFLS